MVILLSIYILYQLLCSSALANIIIELLYMGNVLGPCLPGFSTTMAFVLWVW